MTPTERIRKKLGDWLAESPVDFNKLVLWLQGEGFGFANTNQEPWQTILEGIRPGASQKETEVKLAKRLGAFLETQPDVHRPGRRPDQVLCNLFLLCAALRRPEVLAGPLHAVYKRRAVEGNWYGDD